ncbi:hypothetical protein RHS01_10847 [Rhizoctonia solani]|uniref:CCHC-type domain-containing protein n=1 Tax=Rhizoctonia solani TaxID=456999 RepID=A0A8H7I338_9AGAM|nr:hypothetical protein RHS01_10847 [Rhizoctonia solani]
MSDHKLLNMVAQNMIILKKEFLQLQGAAASIQAVQDQLIHLSPLQSTAPPPPPATLGTATSTNPPLAPTSSNSNLKFAKPNKFGSKKEDALNFIIACQAYIRAKGANQSHEEKILWVTSYFEGAAEDWVQPYKERKSSLSITWTPIAMRNIAKMEQLAAEGFSPGTLRNKYYNGLKNEIKDIMLSTMFQWRCATTQQVYDKAEEIANHIESTCLSNPLVSTVCAPSSAVPTSISNTTPTCAITSIVQTTSGNMPNVRWNGETKDTMIPFPSLKKDERPAAAAPVKPIAAPVPVPASSKGPGPMDLDGRGFSNLTCHVCRGKGHFAHNCPSKPMSGHVANVEWSWERPEKENCIEVVLDEEESGKGKAKAN